ncbi:hypothetical protein KIN20_005273, partial [Parelaphostrongylus tenuis]
SPLLKKERICWFCYEKYSKMCAVLLKDPPSVKAHGIWRGHSMKDKNDVTACPHLWLTKCGYCGATGAAAHMEKSCHALKLRNLDVDSS